MNLSELTIGVGLPDEAVAVVSEVVKRIAKEMPRLLDYRFFRIDAEDYFADIVRYSEQSQTDINANMLGVCCSLAADAYELYRLRGISEQIYFDTFRDLTLWANTCKRLHGTWGLAEYGWIGHALDLRLFRLGRLEFLPEAAERDFVIEGRKVREGSIVVGVHVPEGEPLERDACLRSYAEATKFFKGHDVFLCHSWLLNDKLKSFVGDNSNIIKFQNDYMIVGRDDESRQAEERVFGRVLENPADYPETTALQRGIKQYLLSGQKMGVCTGIFFAKN